MAHLVEIFKDCTYPGVKQGMYIVGEYGTIKNEKTGKTLKPYIDKDGYYKITLISDIPDMRIIQVFIHRLVAYEFCQNPRNLPVVDHKDGNKQNNHYSNLEWVTVKENTLRAERMGLRKVTGEYNGNSKYSPKLVHYICGQFEQGLGCIDIYRNMIGETSVSKEGRAFYKFLNVLRKKQCWEYITSQYSYSTETTERKGNHKIPVVKQDGKYTEDEIRFICNCYSSGKKPIDVLHILKGDDATARQHAQLYDLLTSVKRRERWKYIVNEYDF